MWEGAGRGRSRWGANQRGTAGAAGAAGGRRRRAGGGGGGGLGGGWRNLVAREWLLEDPAQVEGDAREGRWVGLGQGEVLLGQIELGAGWPCRCPRCLRLGQSGGRLQLGRSAACGAQLRQPRHPALLAIAQRDRACRGGGGVAQRLGLAQLACQLAPLAIAQLQSPAKMAA